MTQLNINDIMTTEIDPSKLPNLVVFKNVNSYFQIDCTIDGVVQNDIQEFDSDYDIKDNEILLIHYDESKGGGFILDKLVFPSVNSVFEMTFDVFINSVNVCLLEYKEILNTDINNKLKDKIMVLPDNCNIS